MTERIVIVGAGGFGREVLDIVEALNNLRDQLSFLGFLDDGEVRMDLLARRHVRLLGTTSLMASLDAKYVIGIGSGEVRRAIDRLLTDSSCTATKLVHPTATVGGDVVLGDGVILAAGSRVTTNIELGRHTHVHVNATVGHDSILMNNVSVYPGATVGGNVVLGDGVTIGTGANVLPGVRIGDGSMVGAGAVVTRDVVSNTTVVGVPAREVRHADDP
jgi:sugar O-acyltransferase (sialic acid O-acetyltransferase NeuD family)